MSDAELIDVAVFVLTAGAVALIVAGVGAIAYALWTKDEDQP